MLKYHLKANCDTVQRWAGTCFFRQIFIFRPDCKIGNNFRIDHWLTLADPCMTFDPSNELHFDQGFFLPNLVAIQHPNRNPNPNPNRNPNPNPNPN